MAFRASLGSAELTLVAESDPGRTRRAMAHVAGWALSHVERDAPLELRSVLHALRSTPRSLAEEEIDTSGLEARLREVVEASGARIERRCLLPSSTPSPLWPLKTVTGPPIEGALFPFDRELAAFLLGLRRLIKREPLDAEEAAADAAWLARHGLLSRPAGGGDHEGRRPVLAGSDPALLDRALEAERALGTEGDGDAARFLGDALGYPPCCVEAFLALGRRDDPMLLAARLPSWADGPRDPRLLWACAPLSLFSHVPCTPDCPATLELARSVLAALDRERPGFTSLWRPLAMRVHAIDGEGRSWAFDARGDLASGAVVEDAVELCVPRTADLTAIVRRAPELAGVVLRASGAQLDRSDDARWRAFVIADHRLPISDGSAGAPA